MGLEESRQLWWTLVRKFKTQRQREIAASSVGNIFFLIPLPSPSNRKKKYSLPPSLLYNSYLQCTFLHHVIVENKINRVECCDKKLFNPAVCVLIKIFR